MCVLVFYLHVIYLYRMCHGTGVVVCVLPPVCMSGAPRFDEPGIADGDETPCGCWELKPGPPLQEQVLLIAESAFQSPQKRV